MVEIKRKLYKRGSSFETTIPMPILFALDLTKKYDVIFKFDKGPNKWTIDFEEQDKGQEEEQNKRQDKKPKARK